MEPFQVASKKILAKINIKKVFVYVIMIQEGAKESTDYRIFRFCFHGFPQGDKMGRRRETGGYKVDSRDDAEDEMKIEDPSTVKELFYLFTLKL